MIMCLRWLNTRMHCGCIRDRRLVPKGELLVSPVELHFYRPYRAQDECAVYRTCARSGIAKSGTFTRSVRSCSNLRRSGSLE